VSRVRGKGLLGFVLRREVEFFIGGTINKPLTEEEELFMPKKGEKRIVYCKKCKQETRWIYVNWVLKKFWLCLRCTAREEA
jgi:hypothetical protein